MKKKFSAAFLLLVMCIQITAPVFASSHREAPMIANDPLADNTDVYAFRSPDNPDKITIIANYVPGQLPDGGPNYYSFGENIRYEIHIDNNIATQGDDIIYRFTFKKTNEDPSTFFNIRLGKQNLKTTYKLQRSVNGGKSFQTVVTDGVVPPPNIGPRSISSPVGLNTPDYNTLINKAITTSTSGEKVFCGPADDPFFVDLGGVFDLGDAPRASGKSKDALKCLNVSTIALQIDISTLQKDHKSGKQATSILDPNYVIGVWASASRRQITILNNGNVPDLSSYNNQPGDTQADKEPASTDKDFVAAYHAGPWVQVSRLGMPLTNEAIIPIGYKDLWNSMTPYEDLSKLAIFGKFFYAPELALYMDDTFFGGAVPAFSPLRIQRKSLGSWGFGNDQDGLFALKGRSFLKGTALSEDAFGGLLLPAKKSPRSVDLWPIFHTGVPNLIPYQLANGKNGSPLSNGKPFINNFLPNGGDMLRLNMAVPVTPRNSPAFSSLGLVQAAVIGLTDPAFSSKFAQNIPNMDGFPNGRRLEDDVTRIELQAVAGVVLAAIGLWYDDYQLGVTPSPVTPQLLKVLTYSTGVNANDTTLKTSFPYVQTPWQGTHICDCGATPKSNREATIQAIEKTNVNIAVAAPEVFASASPSPFVNSSTIRYHIDVPSKVTIEVYNEEGKMMKVLVNKKLDAGTYTENWNGSGLAKGVYFIQISKNGIAKQNLRVVKG
jgi:hypothetical protein